MKAKTNAIVSKKLMTLTDNPIRIDIPFFLSRISAGFASPADDYLENSIDLN